MPDFSDVLADLISRQLATFTRFCTLRNLYLHFIGVRKIKAIHTKPPGCDLLYFASAGVSIFIRRIAHHIFTSFTSIAFSAQPVHSNSQCFMSLAGNGTNRHGTGTKPFGNLLNRLHLFNRNRSGLFKFKQSPQCTLASIFLI